MYIRLEMLDVWCGVNHICSTGNERFVFVAVDVGTVFKPETGISIEEEAIYPPVIMI